MELHSIPSYIGTYTHSVVGVMCVMCDVCVCVCVCVCLHDLYNFSVLLKSGPGGKVITKVRQLSQLHNHYITTFISGYITFSYMDFNMLKSWLLTRRSEVRRLPLPTLECGRDRR